MNRRELLKSSLLAAAGLAAPSAQAQEHKQKLDAKDDQSAAHIWPTRTAENGPEPPNVLWIIADEMRYDTIEGLSNSHIHTPNLKRLLDESTTFTNCYVQCPVCAPSRASFLTGRYPHTTGLRANGQRICDTERLVTRILADDGYLCGLAGKLHLSPCGAGQVEDRIDDGYRFFRWSHDISDRWPNQNMWRVWLDQQGVKWPVPKERGVEGPWAAPIDPKYTQTAWCANQAIEFMRQQGKMKPWLMSVNCYQPHPPYMPTEEYMSHYNLNDMPLPNYVAGELENKPVYQRVDNHGSDGGRGFSFADADEGTRRKTTAAYYAMVEQVDTEVGRMLKVLDETGQADNTIVIFMSDHGEMLGDHGIYMKGPYFYDALTHVPLIIRWPGKYKAGHKVDALVEMVDITPTLLEAAGLPIPTSMVGQTLTPLLTGQATTHRDSVYCEHFDSSWLYSPPPMASCVRTATHKLSYYQGLPLGELYDLKNDPAETHNLWFESKYKDVRAEMTELLLSRMVDTVDRLPERRTLF